MVYLENAMRTVQNEYFAFLVAVVTDASGECHKAQQILALKYPDIVFLDCYVHQVCHTLFLPPFSPNINSFMLDKSGCWGLL